MKAYLIQKSIIVVTLIYGPECFSYPNVSEEESPSETVCGTRDVFQANSTFLPQLNRSIQIRANRFRQDAQAQTLNQSQVTSQQSAKDNTESIGVGVTSKSGARDGLGLVYARRFRETQSSDLDANREQRETWRDDLVKLRGAVAVSSIATVGIDFRMLRQEANVQGSFFSREGTSILSTVNGLGVGFSLHDDKVEGFGGFQWPMRGKGKIIGEEKIIIEPGRAELGFDSKISNDMGFGLLYRRWIYERDDRSKPTTLSSDQDRTIDVRGLSPMKYFFLDRQFSTGIRMGSATQLQWTTSFTRSFAEIIRSADGLPTTDGPGQFSFNTFGLGVGAPHRNFRWGIGGEFSSWKSSRKNDNQAEQIHKGTGVTLTASLASDI